MAKKIVMRKQAFTLCVAAVGILLVGCGSSAADDIAGNWSPSDRTAVKTIMNNGACRGMYYYQGKSLDIGGGMTCSYSQNKDSAGFHSMVVSQPPNQSTLKLKFINPDTVEVYDASGKSLLTMKRL